MTEQFRMEDYLGTVYDRLADGGIFLTVKGPNPNTQNTMTIGWGGVTRFWSRPVFIVPVRQSRYTFELIEKAQEFTVSVPLDDATKRALAYCGSRSGRVVDKFQECELTAVPGRIIDTPTIGECQLHFECRVVYQQTMAPENLDDGIKEQFYPDYHTMYYGEIVACYLTENGKQ